MLVINSWKDMECWDVAGLVKRILENEFLNPTFYNNAVALNNSCIEDFFSHNIKTLKKIIALVEGVTNDVLLLLIQQPVLEQKKHRMITSVKK